MKLAAVLVPYPVDKAYDYIVPPDIEFGIGDFVRVPLGNREITGVVWGKGSGEVAKDKLKSVIAKYPFPSLSQVHLDFIDWVAKYTLSAKGSVLKMTLNTPSAFLPLKTSKAYKISSLLQVKEAGKEDFVVDSTCGIKITPQREKVLAVMMGAQPMPASEIAAMAKCSTSVIKGMEQAGLLEEVCLQKPYPCTNPDISRAGANLSKAQDEVAKILKENVCSGSFKADLLDGVTGAGKTEVYFEAVMETLRQGKQALILLPEIALSNAFLQRFKDRFGCAPALWHSGLSSSKRNMTWRGVATGKTRVVVGARSALFLPYSNLGLIVVDEEHDPAYKQEDGVIYNARDMSVLRAHLASITVILVSATPSLETMHNVWKPPEGTGRYGLLHLPSRFGGACLPEIKTIDMRDSKPSRGNFLSPILIEEIEKTLAKKEQTLLFLNRRGYAPLTLCRTCGHRFECPRCTAWLVEHKKSGHLHCHHCDYHTILPKKCPECDDTDSFTACGPGVERIYEEASIAFPDARIALLASDTAQTGDDLRSMLQKIVNHEFDIIIGTQIIAKGHHFPNLTLVGVVDADLGMQGGDLRAAERTYQLLHQVAGRAGRAEKKGHVYLQSWMPEQRIIKALANGQRDEFLAIEAAERKVANMPPYSRLAGIIISGRDENQVLELAKELGRKAPQGTNEKGLSIQTLGPAPAPLSRLRGKYRYRLLVRADKEINIQKTISKWISSTKISSNIRVYIDIDPQSFL